LVSPLGLYTPSRSFSTKDGEIEERGGGAMLATKRQTNGHYKVTKAPLATDYVWVEGEEEVEERLLDEILHPWHATYAEWVKEERAHPELQEQKELEALR
jgi:hypothetical protein